MLNHRLTIKHWLLQPIKDGSKPLDLRPANGMHLNIKAGDTITFLSSKAEVLCQVSAVNRYENLSEAITDETAGQLGPGFTRQQVIDAVRSFYPRWKGAFLIFRIRYEEQ